ncbi:uncharacterized protein LOC108202863 isoform X2 [Daucus carota subsp. sativus]|uniref:uncharacterized protein LOC108202863 isoform X2 n=1 Tax=Daucus carota subsp. sativus TaxID=79200 RepID=UPI0007EFA929|nr:PREDICTED: small G protein signaling modulator 1 isoform X2 [Daucus carota subsp. sativus]
MSFEGDSKQWMCGKGRTVNLLKVSSIVRDIGEPPCLHQLPLQINKMLKPEKWHATFDDDGKIFGFQKALKSIVLGGVDPTIRAEVWEFLLGCYTLSSTTEYRKQLRIARRERYKDLVKQCQMMHSSIGTGSLAYAVGSKVMDMRTMSKEDGTSEADVSSRRASNNNNIEKIETYCDSDYNCTDTSHACPRESSSDSVDLSDMRESTDGAPFESSCYIPSSSSCNCSSIKPGSAEHGSLFVAESYSDFPPLPVTNLFEKSSNNEKVPRSHDDRISGRRKLRFEDDHVYNFQINNNVDLIMESKKSSSSDMQHGDQSEIEMAHPDVCESISRFSDSLYEAEIVNRLRVSGASDVADTNATTSQGGAADEEKVSEWLWTLHQIVVDVVRTDSHLEFYEDTKNLARMADILAVYAWVDPATGYCQGMSDLLSPFVVLFEDDADAFWCFEMLLRRMRENFQMDGPTGVIKQLQALWHILEVADKEMFAHLSHIGAENLHFAFRMLLVLFRREISFNEALCMWEMMWAADFDESLACHLNESCPKLLTIQIHRESVADTVKESSEHHNCSSKGRSHMKPKSLEQSILENGIKTVPTHPFCGLTKNLWSKNDQFQICTIISSTKNGDDELPVFCVAAILILNRQKIIRETHSIDDLIKIFNDNMLKIRVKRCVQTAIKLRKKYFYKLIRNRSSAARAGDGSSVSHG